MPKVSICIPTYNQIKYLRRTLQSISEQTFDDYEVIITDDTPSQIVADLIKTFDFKGKLKYYQNDCALGSPKNWNECVSRATGEFIKLMHHDDWFSSSMSLKSLVSLLSNDNEFVFCACDNIPEDVTKHYYHSITKAEAEIIKIQPELLFLANKIGAPSVTLFKRNDMIFDERIKYLVDLEYYIRLIKKNPNFSYTTEVLVNIGLNEGQITNAAIVDKELLIFEYSYTYQKLIFTKDNFEWCFKAFWNLFNQLNIRSATELKDLGWHGDIPKFVRYIIIAKKLANRAKKNKLKNIIKDLALKYTKHFTPY